MITFAVIFSLVIIGSLIIGIWFYINEHKQPPTEHSLTASTTTPTPISFKRGYELTELPVVTFYQGSNRFHFVLDTGCSMSTLNPAMLEKLEYIETPHKQSYFGIDGKSICTSIVAVELTYQDKTYGEYFQVMKSDEAFKTIKKESGVTITGLLGSSFFERYKYLIDFSEMIAYSKA